DGAPVAPGTPVVELETSKAVEELLCEHAGFLRAHVEVGTEVPVGAHLATISPRAPEPADEPAPDAGGERFTAPGTASDRAAGAAPAGTAAALPTATSDLAPLGAAHPPAATARTHLLDRVQQGTAAVVARAHREVPAAFTAVEVRVDRLLDRLARFSSDHDAEVGITEALVKAVAAAHPEFGLLFGSLVDDRTVALAPTPHVAITMDAGKGLYTPVVRDCADRPLIDLADDIMDLRVKAVRGSFSAAELTGATITISLNTGDDVLLAVPIVMWPQLAMVSLSATRTRLDLVDGELRQSRVVTLGLAYDHRAINGREASEFLRAVADSLREPERIDELLD
uniref:2-oxo acid dehydrogenase subunit E2 n=1 Tax=Actinosynnema sp. TaxID=1872144 RepID=UPI003F84DDE4